MRNAPDLTDAILAAPHGVNCRVRVIYGDDFIADDVPVESGTLTATDGNAVPERVTLQVPVRDNKGRVWEPSEPTSPLNNFGQRLEISYQIIPRRHSAAIDIPLGQFRINNWDVNAGKVSVNAEGLLALVEESIFTVPASPLVGQTFSQAIAWILDDIIPLVFHPGLPEDEVITEVLQWDRDRLGAVFDILDAWAVRGRVSSEGVFVVEPLSSIDTELFSWTDGQNGTVVSAPRSGSRDGIFNAVVARSSANELSDYEQVVAQAAVYSTNHLIGWGSPYGNVPYEYTSPLFKSARQAEIAAMNILRRLTRWAETRVVTAIPDPRYELGDFGSVTTLESVGISKTVGEIVSYTLPLTAAQGPATYQVSTIGEP